jgi:hypothetical protein
MEDSTNPTLEEARRWTKRGRFVLPVGYRDKNPLFDDWPQKRLTLADLPRYFNNGELVNLGVLQGAPYGAADADLDCIEAVQAFTELGPETGLVFGRASAPASHHFYNADPPIKSTRYCDPIKKKETLLEIRCLTKDGEVGLQTVVPPSIHKETGEQIRFDLDGEVANVDADVLVRAAAHTAAAALARYWPAAKSGRNEAFLALSGMLARAAWREKDVLPFIRAIYRCLWPQRPDFDAAGREVKYTFDRFSRGGKITGFTRLTQLMDAKVVRKAAEWLEAATEGVTRTLEFDPEAVPAGVAGLNGLQSFSGLLSFAAVKKRGPVIVATLTNGTEIVWRSSNDLIHFAKAQAVIADATGVFIPTPPGKSARNKWEPVAEKILKIASQDSQPGGSSLAEQFRELLPMVWSQAGRLKTELPEDLVEELKHAKDQLRYPLTAPAACCVWWVHEKGSPTEGECWVYLPHLLAWLNASLVLGRRFEWADAKEALWLLGFRYAKDTHRSAGGQEVKASVWIGPGELLEK